MSIKMRARYDTKPKMGLIRISKIMQNQPIEYTLQLFDETIGIIRTSKNLFSTIQAAIGHATLYGFASSFWFVEEKDI